CGLADAGAAAAAEVARLTDELAEALVRGRAPRGLPAGLAGELPETIAIAVPEGFAYYALHPLDYAEAMAARAGRDRRAVVVGIRSIGTTVSAVARAALARGGCVAERLTVRPAGHPWERVVEFSEDELRVLRARGDAEFVVVDEGPGLSGSSFLAVAEALERAGVARERITLVGSHTVDAARLCARDAAQRWTRFRFEAVAGPRRVPQGREWCPKQPGWRQFERRKYLSPDGKTLFKFEGLGRYGDAVVARARALAEEGFSPAVERAGDGFAAYEFVPGGPMRAEGLDQDVIRRMAEYCAARARLFPADEGSTGALAEMVAVNSREGLGREASAELVVERPVIADGKMQPHEWIREGGKVWKTDGASHGDDHFFPGPTDIAWDLAGASVEWEMDAATEEELLAEYRRASGDDARGRIVGWKTAYVLFRLGYCEMAASAGEEGMREEAERYRGFLSSAEAGSPSPVAA
ncbi:MAG TPA: hypothetical protein VLA96_09165, partial [Terriglobales bacterium]|nr:hypothetical protein [Terriglobales bacterium]